MLDEHFRVMGRAKFYAGAEEMQANLDAYLVIYNTKRPDQGRNAKIKGEKIEKIRVSYPSPGAATVR